MGAKSSKKTIAIQPESGSLAETAAKLASVREEMLDEYKKNHRAPWIIAYSGGKDSTLLLQMVFDLLLALPPEERRRAVHIVGNDTLVESPLVITHLRESIDQIRRAATRLDLPLRTMMTVPDTDQTFWVNVIGRGYPPPSRIFRWCTDRMKIQPTSGYITRRISERGKVILLIGARKSESINRRRTMEKRHRRGNRLSKHPTHDKCMVFSPLAELDTEEVWTVLLQTRPPWGGSHRKLMTLYQDESLADFVSWLVEISEMPERKVINLCDDSVYYSTDNKMAEVFNLATRREIYDKLKTLQENIGIRLISGDDDDFIRHIWRNDKILFDVRSRKYHVDAA